MGKYIIEGGRELYGSLTIKGAKNSVLTLLAASILTPEKVVLHGCPDIGDVAVMLRILRKLGCKVERTGDIVEIDSSGLHSYKIACDPAKELRSSVFMLGSLLSRLKRAKAVYPGGCDIGLRPIDIHLAGLRELGVTVGERHGHIDCDGTNAEPADIMLDLPSVGATENLMMACVFLNGVSILRNCAKEPEIVDLQNFLNAMGAKVRGAGGSVITVEGVKRLHGVEYTPIPDRIVAGTWLIGAAMCGGKLTLENVVPEHISSLLSKLPKSSCKIYPRDGKITIESKGRHRAVPKTETMYYPGFPTDLQAQMTALQSVSDGTAVIVENIFETRFRSAVELCKMGANITVSGNTAVVRGVPELYGSRVVATDLRGGASLVLAAAAAAGRSEIDEIHHIDRGYEDLAAILSQVGVNIQRE